MNFSSRQARRNRVLVNRRRRRDRWYSSAARRAVLRGDMEVCTREDLYRSPLIYCVNTFASHFYIRHRSRRRRAGVIDPP